MLVLAPTRELATQIQEEADRCEAHKQSLKVFRFPLVGGDQLLVISLPVPMEEPPRGTSLKQWKGLLSLLPHLAGSTTSLTQDRCRLFFSFKLCSSLDVLAG